MDKQTQYLILAINVLQKRCDLLSASAVSPSPMSHHDSEQDRKLSLEAKELLERAVMEALEPTRS